MNQESHRHLLFPLLLLLMLVSCSDKEEYVEVPELADAFTIRLTSGSGFTRAGISDDYGSAMERRIDAADVAVLSFSKEGSLLEVISLPGDGSVSADNGEDLAINVKLDREIYRRAGDVTFVVIANHEDAVKEEDFRFVPGVTTLDYVRELTWLIPSDQASVGKIPMYGESTFKLTSVKDGEEKSIRLDRKWGKVTIVDKAEYEIRGVTMAGVPDVTGSDGVTFAKGKEGDYTSFYAYFPRMRFSSSDPKSSEREIVFNAVKEGDTEGKQLHFYFAKISDNEYVESDDSYWNALTPNMNYVFSITGSIDNSGVEPDIEVKDEIVILYSSDFDKGKFSCNKIRMTDKDGRLLSIAKTIDYVGIGFSGYVLNLKNNNVSFNDIYYVFLDEYDEEVGRFRLLKSDFVKIEDELDRTRVYVNNTHISGTGGFENGYKPGTYRFYTTNEKYNTIYVKVWNDSDRYLEYDINFLTDTRGYRYAEFEFTQFVRFKSIDYTLYSGTQEVYGTYSQEDIFEETRDGVTRFVFYLD